MKRVLLFLATGLIFIMIACKPNAIDVAADDKEAPDSTVDIIPERPTEIEVLDLTKDVDLFIVVAGAYSSASGAQKKADELKKDGFLNADVIQRPGSRLYSALVERFDSETAAKVFADEIATNKEIKSYVYKLDD